MTLVTNDWNSRIIERGTDPFGLGRWTYFSLRGKGKIKVMIVTAYRVSQEYLSSVGQKTAAMQQFRHLSQQNREAGMISDPKPKYQFIIDLQAWLQEMMSKEYEIILCLDANESIDSKVGQFSPLQYSLSKPITGSGHDGTLATLIRTCGLCDPLTIQHHGEPPPATYKRGHRIDFILTSSKTTEAVIRSGLFPYDSIFIGDHRACYIDLDVMTLFHDTLPAITPPKYRGLRTHDPRVVSKSVKILQSHITYHKLEEKTHQLYNQAKCGEWSQEAATRYEQIDKLLTEGMLHAEKSVSRKYSKKYHWSPKLSTALKTLHYWQLRLQVAKGNPFNQNKLILLQQQLNIQSDQMEIPTILIVQELKAARYFLKEYQKDHIQLREEHLKTLAEARILARKYSILQSKTARSLDKRIAKEIHRIKRKKALKLMHSRVNRALHPGDVLRGLQSVDIPASESSLPFPEGPDPEKTWKGPWRSISDPEEMAAHICAANARQYHQSHSSPFCSEPLLSYFGYDAENQGSKHLVEGILPPAHILSHLLPETQNI
jgi:hypothetical protein